MDPSLYSESEACLHRELLNEEVKRRRVAWQTSHMITIDVEKMSFIVNGSVDVERVFKALREVLGDVVIMHERETAEIDVPPQYSGLETIIHIKRSEHTVLESEWHRGQAMPCNSCVACLGRTG